MARRRALAGRRRHLGGDGGRVDPARRFESCRARYSRRAGRTCGLVDAARESESLTLETTLIDAHLRLSSAAAEVAAARDVLLPKLDQAEQSAARAFRAGALTYTEWAQVQGDASDARRGQLPARSKQTAHSSKSNDSPARPLSRPNLQGRSHEQVIHTTHFSGAGGRLSSGLW